jgi:hypothetical protein
MRPESFGMEVNFWQVLRRGSARSLAGPTQDAARLNLLAFIRFASRRFVGGPSPCFAKYQPAPRLGTRRVEQRLLSRLARTQLETTC